jgi:FXSXX-COOH protein
MGDMSLEHPDSNSDSPMVDLGGVSLDQVAQLDDSTLVRSLNRILGDVKNPDGVVLASFSASI